MSNRDLARGWRGMAAHHKLEPTPCEFFRLTMARLETPLESDYESINTILH
jgi:hypothetical protein